MIVKVAAAAMDEELDCQLHPATKTAAVHLLPPLWGIDLLCLTGAFVSVGHFWGTLLLGILFPCCWGSSSFVRHV